MSTKIVTNSEAGKSDLKDAFNIASSKIEVVNNAVKDPNISIKPDQNRIVFAGRLHQIKGVEVLVKALAIVKEEFNTTKLFIIGEDESTGELEKLKKLQREHGLEENIIFSGNQSRKYVLEQFSKAYLTIVPSLFEAFGYVVIESFSVHTPVIGSDTTGIATIIRDGKDGFLFRTGDHTDLARKIIFALKNNKIREKMSLNCYQNFKENYELDQVVKELAENPQIFN